MVINSRMGFNGSKQKDPVKRAEKDLTTFNPDINNNGGSLYNFEEFSIVSKYKTEQEKQRDENEKNGYGDVTDSELMIYQDYRYYEAFHSSNDWQFDQDIFVPLHYTAGDSYVGHDGKTYTPILDEDGEVTYLDSDDSCVMDKGGLSSTTPTKVNDDLIDKDQAYNINYKVDAQGNETQRSKADADFQLALTRIDNQYTKLPNQLDATDRIAAEVTGSNNFKSTTSSGIQTAVKPTESFSAAASPETKQKSVVFKESEPLPWANKPAADTAANNPQFGLSA